MSYALAPLLHAAQSYPERPIRLIISASPGTGADYFGRTIAQSLSEMYKQQVIADNRTGAGGRFRPSPHAADLPARCAARS